MDLTGTNLRTRTGLPDALSVLRDEFPRTGWQEHENFGQMVQFWMNRHVMFRDLMERLRSDAEKALDGPPDFESYAPQLSRYGGFFLQELHSHHSVEDHHYFPQLVGLDARIARGFDILDSDHKELHGLLDGFAESANGVLTRPQDLTSAVGSLQSTLTEFQRFLDRHLTDEEDLIVPVILKTGFEG
ncbi:MAG: hemerythrin domain-containing protein [Pseudomonadota bacterium]